MPGGVPRVATFFATLFVAGGALAADGVGSNRLPSSRGFELGVRVGIAHPGGAVGAGSPATTPSVSDVAPTWVPIGLDGGYRLWRSVYVGASFEWGSTVGQGGGGSCVSCVSGYDLQGRTEVRLYALPARTWDPCLSLGFGWEVLHIAQGDSSSATYEGPILGNLQVGLDVRSRAFAVGPYFGASLAEFVTRSLDPAHVGETSSIDGRVVHEWFTFGVRGSYGPW